MADEKAKRPKIDLKSRIPSKTVKGLTPVTGPGAAIPPPPGAVPAPPPDLLGNRKSVPPKMTADPNDPLGAAQMGGVPASAPQQQIVVVGEEGGHASKTGVFIGLIVLALGIGSALGFVLGKNNAGNAIKTKAQGDAKELSEKVAKTNENLAKFSDLLKAAADDLENKDVIDAAKLEAIKKFESGMSSNDLKGREIAYFGEETSGKIVAYVAKVAFIDSMRAVVTRNNAIEAVMADLKTGQLDGKKTKYGVLISKAGTGKDDPAITTASLIDFGDPFDLKPALTAPVVNEKEKTVTPGKLTVKGKALDVWPGGEKAPDFMSKEFMSVIDTRDFKKVCPIYANTKKGASKPLRELQLAIDGDADDPGVLKPGKELVDKLKNLGK